MRVIVRLSLGGWRYEGEQDTDTGELSLSCTGAAERKGVARKALDWAAAESALALRGPLPTQAQEVRLATCATCDARVAEGTESYCSACQCPHWKRATLTVKATMPADLCPRGLWPLVG